MKKVVKLARSSGPHLFVTGTISMAQVRQLEKRVAELEAALAKALTALRQHGVSSITTDVSQH